MKQIVHIAFTLSILLRTLGATEVDVFLAAGESNAKANWAVSIEQTLNRLRPDTETVVVHSFHSGNWLQSWWNDGPQQNYRDNLTALKSKFAELETAGKQPTLRGVFWFQGEGDSGSYAAMDLYKDRFRSYINQLESDMDATGISALIVAIDGNQDPFYDIPENLDGRNRAQVEYMRNIHFELGAELNGFTVDSRDYARSDAWHLTNTELISLGGLLGEKYFLDYWSPGYGISTQTTKVENGMIKIEFTAPAGISNWRISSSQDLSEFTPLSRSAKNTYEQSSGAYMVETQISESAEKCFYIISSP